MSPMFYLIVVLGIAWLGVRYWSARREARRAEEREQRMESLLDEQESLLLAEKAAAEAPGEAPAEAAPPVAERHCLGCRALNPADAKVCQRCGLEL